MVVSRLTELKDYPKEEIVNGTLTELGYACPIRLFNERNINMKERDNGNKKWTLPVSCILGALVVLLGWLLTGCSVGLHGGADFNLYYSEKSSLGISGDPYKSRGSGISRNMGTKPASAFQTFNGDK
jgi:hypothetical protein